jgi:hypothetical protein
VAFGASKLATATTLIAPAGNYNSFDAVLINGASTAWGIVGSVTSGTNCITSGGAAGV